LDGEAGGEIGGKLTQVC